MSDTPDEWAVPMFTPEGKPQRCSWGRDGMVMCASDGEWVEWEHYAELEQAVEEAPRWHIGQGLPCGCEIKADRTRTIVQVRTCSEEHGRYIWMDADKLVDPALRARQGENEQDDETYRLTPFGKIVADAVARQGENDG